MGLAAYLLTVVIGLVVAVVFLFIVLMGFVVYTLSYGVQYMYAIAMKDDRPEWNFQRPRISPEDREQMLNRAAAFSGYVIGLGLAGGLLYLFMTSPFQP